MNALGAPASQRAAAEPSLTALALFERFSGCPRAADWGQSAFRRKTDRALSQRAAREKTRVARNNLNAGLAVHALPAAHPDVFIVPDFCFNPDHVPSAAPLRFAAQSRRARTRFRQAQIIPFRNAKTPCSVFAAGTSAVICRTVTNPASRSL